MLCVSLVWSLNFYLNPAHHTVYDSQILTQPDWTTFFLIVIEPKRFYRLLAFLRHTQIVHSIETLKIHEKRKRQNYLPLMPHVLLFDATIKV